MAKNIVFKVSADTTGVTTGMNQAADATNKATKSVSQLDKTLANLGTAVAGAFALSQIMDFGKAVFNISKEMQSLNVRMNGLYGDATKANQALAGLRETADKLGMDFMAMTNNYVQFVGAAKASGMEVAKAEKIFKSMSVAIAGSGANAEQAGRAMTALTQMIGKGKISAEELRGQLGEAMPAAFGIMAKSLGVTTAELDKMMSTGQLMANDVLPKFAKEMEKAFGANAQAMAEGMQGNMARLKNAWEGYMTSLGERFYGNAGGAQVLTDMLNWWTEINESQEQYIQRESARLVLTDKEQAIADKRLEKLREEKKTAEELLQMYEKETAMRLKIANEIKKTGSVEEYTTAVKTAQAHQNIVNLLREEIAQKNKKVPLTDAELKAIQKQRDAAIKLKQEMEKALKDIYKVDITNLEPTGEGSFPGVLGEKAKREARIREANEAEQLAKDMREFELSQQEREIQDFKDKEAKKTEIAKQQQEQRKANEVALYSGLASTAQAWGQRELSIQQANLDKRREQGVISEEAYLNQLKQIKRKQFMLDKLGAVAQIGINTAVNVSQASNPISLPLVPGIIASGAIQAGIVLAQPIPYKKGTKRVPMVRGAVRGQDSVHTILTPGERVTPEEINSQPGYSALLDLAQDRKISDKEAGFLAEVATSGMRPAKTATIDPEVFGKAIAKHIPGTRVNIDENGIMVISERSTYESKRLRTRL